MPTASNQAVAVLPAPASVRLTPLLTLSSAVVRRKALKTSPASAFNVRMNPLLPLCEASAPSTSSQTLPPVLVRSAYKPPAPLLLNSAAPCGITSQKVLRMSAPRKPLNSMSNKDRALVPTSRAASSPAATVKRAPRPPLKLASTSVAQIAASPLGAVRSAQKPTPPLFQASVLASRANASAVALFWTRWRPSSTLSSMSENRRALMA